MSFFPTLGLFRNTASWKSVMANRTYRDAQGRIVRAGFSIVSSVLGGNELNYNSDIDLLFLYSHDGETAGGNERESIITNKEYYVHVAHAITRTITQATTQGEVFRVDLRLRPEGEQGDLAISMNSAKEYYEHRARDWELQMLIKARHSAGDARLTRDFLRSVEEYVYRSPGDFVAVESILLSRERISRKLRETRGQAIDVKRHRGGIRDIEFLVQCLQRLHGLQDHWVRSGGTLFALRKLNDKSWLSNRDYAALSSAYEFLRKVEHRIQMQRGQQNHRLPAEQGALDRLGRRTGVGKPGERPGDVLLRRVQAAFAVVDEIYQRVIHPGDAAVPGTAFELKPAPTFLSDAGHQSFDSLLSFLDSQAPEVSRVVREAGSAGAGAAKHHSLAHRHCQPVLERFASALRQTSDPAARHCLQHLSVQYLLDGIAGSSSRRIWKCSIPLSLLPRMAPRRDSW